MVQPSPCEVVPQTGRKAAAGDSPYLGHPHKVAAAGGPSRPYRHAVAPAAPARAAKPPRSRSAYGVAAVISAVGEGVRCMAAVVVMARSRSRRGRSQLGALRQGRARVVRGHLHPLTWRNSTSRAGCCRAGARSRTCCTRKVAKYADTAARKVEPTK